ncbi:MAG: UbiD family decarboxylase, partial [Candidatus Binatia bacterium]|nr:UbiD family decarboxylase [Candidatus Binatia bacterium]
MPKNLRTFIEDMRRAYPSEVVSISKPVNPANYDVTAIVKQLGALKKFPMLIFERPLNLHGKLSDTKLVIGAENTQKKIQVALGLPRDMDRAEMARECLRREANKISPVVVGKDSAPVKEVIQRGGDVDLYELPLMRHHEMDGGSYIDMSSVAEDRNSGVYNCSYHRMEVKDRNHTGFFMSLQHMWRIFRAYDEAREECPVATVIGHHSAYQMGACYGGPFEVSEYEIIGGYMEEPLRLTPSETWGERLLVPADAEIVIEGVIRANAQRMEGPFGEFTGYYGHKILPSPVVKVGAIYYRNDPISIGAPPMKPTVGPHFSMSFGVAQTWNRL